MEAPQQQEIAPHLADYYHVILKHKWTTFFVLIAVVILTALFTIYTEPVYQSTATLVIEQEQTASPLTGERMDFESFASQTLTFNTHFKLIKSRPVLEKVIKKLKLDRPEYSKDMEISPIRQILAQVKNNIKLLLSKEEPPKTPDEVLLELTEALKMKISIEQVRDTRLLKISVEDRDPKQARDIANTLAESYIEFNTANRMAASRNTLAWIADQSYAMKQNLEAAEQDFVEYKQNHLLFSVEGKIDLITQKIEEFNSAYLETRNKRQELDAKLNKLREMLQSGNSGVEVRSLIDSPIISTLYSKLLSLDTELSTLSQTYKSKHPKIVQAKSALEETKLKFRDEIKKELTSMEAERSVLIAKENALQKNISDFEKDALETSKKELEYGILRRNVDTNQKLYDTLLEKLKEADVVEDVDTSNIRVAEPAFSAVNPIRPKKRLNMMLSVVLGLMAGLGLSFLQEYLDQTFRTEDEVLRYLEVPVLTVVPVGDPKKSKQ
ncbi:GumC family protein [Desulfatibacillum aliphaticivorans]|uniref:Lipopolysaccharide biosynthesis protein n=1 Tax=Desulfatibacillum aliphaticivorans TaxID=218208 RepID=B8FH46_DESAL|nr:GumC family protein [Desulfatibacillum aliphaticivorans]ACL02134.1 lipopolysaccharide biosynthesis protein [Desulfatibacillum aliphaticivorans]